MIAFRLLQGAAGGLIGPAAQAIMFAAFPEERRGTAVSLVGVGTMAALVLGPILGGALIQYVDWRWIFFVQVPFGFAAAALAYLALPAAQGRAVPFDFPGLVFLTAFVGAGLLAVDQGSVRGWAEPAVVALLVVSAAGLGGLVARARSVQAPLVALRLFANPVFTLGTASAVALNIGLFGSAFLFPVYLQEQLGFDAVAVSLILLPQGLVMIVAMLLAGKLIDRVGAHLPLAAGVPLIIASMFLQAGMTAETGVAAIIAYTVLRGFGMALAFPAINKLVLGAVAPAALSQASGLSNMARQLGGTYGIAALSTLAAARRQAHEAALGSAAGAAGTAATLAFQEMFWICGAFMAIVALPATVALLCRR